MYTTWKARALYVAGSPIAAIITLFVFVALVTGRIRVSGYWRTWRQMRAGSVLLISNHPSLMEAFATPALFWPWQLLGHTHCFPWNIADVQLLGKASRWLFPALRCIPIDRRENTAGPTGKAVIRTVRQLFVRGHSVVLYPEGGRTCKGKEFTHRNGRYVRACTALVVNMAHARQIPVIVVAVRYGDISRARTICGDALKLFTTRLEIDFNEPRPVAVSMDGRGVEQLLLSV